MTRWRQHPGALFAFFLLACTLVLAGAANAQGAPPAARVDGIWLTTWGGGEARLDLTQKGTAVTGIYSGTNDGRVKGTIAGNVLTGSWLGAANDSGGFVLRFSADGKSFSGTWGMGASKTDGGPWEGKRP
jgi:hypothetical protein